MRKHIMLISIAAALASCGSGGTPDSNGAAIFLTGRDSTGKILSSDIDREALKEPGRVISCADCHGTDRKGLRNGIPDFGPYRAPNITAKTLLTDRTPERPAYDASSLRLAITAGKDPAGRRLHYPMPRWKLDDKNLDDLVRYLVTPDNPDRGS